MNCKIISIGWAVDTPNHRLYKCLAHPLHQQDHKENLFWHDFYKPPTCVPFINERIAFIRNLVSFVLDKVW